MLTVNFFIEQFGHWKYYCSPPLSLRIGVTTGNVSVRSNLNAALSRIIKPENRLKACLKNGGKYEALFS